MIEYLFFRTVVWLVSLMPFSLLYIFANFVAFLLNHLIAYRKNVILTNLQNAFPNKTESEIQTILKAAYKNLSDILLEGLKGMTCNQDELNKRYHFVNPEMVSGILEKGQSVIGLVAHFNNWEWGAYTAPSQINAPVIAVSRSIKNPNIDRYIKKNRERFGTKIIDMKATARVILEKRERPCLFVLIADQSPNTRKTQWLTFLNQETSWLTGPDKLARRTNYPVIYFQVQRLKRGFYEIEAIMLHKSPADSPEREITKHYVKKLEKTIIENPENWLWSHRRWKKKRIRE